MFRTLEQSDRVRLIEETLSDESKVFNIEIDGDDFKDVATFLCSSKEEAENVFSTLTRSDDYTIPTKVEKKEGGAI